MDMVVGKEYDVAQLFQEEWQPPKSPIERDKRRGGRFETEEFYLSVCTSFHICVDVFITVVITGHSGLFSFVCDTSWLLDDDNQSINIRLIKAWQNAGLQIWIIEHY